MISGQAPNVQNQADCQIFDDVRPGHDRLLRPGAGQRLRVPVRRSRRSPASSARPASRGATTTRAWAPTPRARPRCAPTRAINSRDNTQTATATDKYATRHNPFVYFHSIIDDTTLCDTPRRQPRPAPPGPLERRTAPPTTCSSRRTCATTATTLRAPTASRAAWPRPTAFLQDMGAADHRPRRPSSRTACSSSPSTRRRPADSSSCCGEIARAGQPRAGRSTVPAAAMSGAVLLSPCIAPGTVSQHPLQPLHDAAAASRTSSASRTSATPACRARPTFGSDIFNRSCGPPPIGAAGRRPRHPRAAARVRVGHELPHPAALERRRRTYTVQVRSLTSAQAGNGGHWLAATHETHLTFIGALGATYRVPGPGRTAARSPPPPRWSRRGTRIQQGHFSSGWRVVTAPRCLAAARDPDHHARRRASRCATSRRAVGDRRDHLARGRPAGHPRRPHADAAPALTRAAPPARALLRRGQVRASITSGSSMCGG